MSNAMKLLANLRVQPALRALRENAPWTDKDGSILVENDIANTIEELVNLVKLTDLQLEAKKEQLKNCEGALEKAFQDNERLRYELEAISQARAGDY